MRYETLTPRYDADLASLIRRILKDYHLDIPGTAYYDETLDHLSACYQQPSRVYNVLLEEDRLIGGIGLAEFEGFPDCCELQKLYLEEAFRGRGIGTEMIAHIENDAVQKGYRQIYLETHTNLQAAIRLYEKCGYHEIERPASVVHSTMNRFYLKDLSRAAKTSPRLDNDLHSIYTPDVLQTEHKNAREGNIRNNRR